MGEKEYCKDCDCLSCAMSLKHCGKFVNGCSHCVICNSEKGVRKDCEPKKLNDDMVAKYNAKV